MDGGASEDAVGGLSSGVELEVPNTAIHQFRDGKVLRDRNYLDRATALEAAGLRE